MADSNISSLPAVEALDDDSLLVAEQQGEARQLKARLLKDYAQRATNVPSVSTADNGKFLRVVDGAWAAVLLTDVSEVGA